MYTGLTTTIQYNPGPSLEFSQSQKANGRTRALYEAHLISASLFDGRNWRG